MLPLSLRPSFSYNHIKATLYLIILLLFSQLFCSRATEEGHSDFTSFLEPRSSAVRAVAKNVALQMAQRARCASSSDCDTSSCIYHRCSGTFGKTECVTYSDLMSPCSSGLFKTKTYPEMCAASSKPKGTLVNLKAPVFQTRPGITKSSGNGMSIHITDPSAKRDICALKNAANSLISEYTDKKLYLPIYTGTTSGTMFSYPGSAACRDSNASDPLITCSFDPRTRPWYITSASGPRDVIFLFDKTALAKKESILREALAGAGDSALRGLDNRDHIAIIAYNDTSASVVGGFNGVERATDEVKDRLAQNIKSMSDNSGFPNLTIAFDKAFELFLKSKKEGPSAHCSKIIVLFQGFHDSCFEKCARDNSRPCTCVRDITSHVDKLQYSLSGKTESRTESRMVSIVALTESFHTDSDQISKTSNLERLAQTLVCTRCASGVWQRVTDKSTSEDALAGFHQLSALALYDEDPSVFSSGLYIDAWGYGEIFTLALPVYDGTKLVAVVGVDNTIGEIINELGDEVKARKEINDYSTQSRRCPKARTRDGCELQALRRPLGAQCAPKPEKMPSSGCFQFGQDMFWASSDEKSYFEAEKYCNSLPGGSILAVANTITKNGVLSGIFDMDGSWIGLNISKVGSADTSFTWADGTALDLKSSQFEFSDINSAVDAANERNEGACVMADHRGITGNWNIVPCSQRHRYVCQLRSSGGNDSICGIAKSHAVFNLNDFSSDNANPVRCPELPSSGCLKEQDEQLERSNPLCEQQGKNYTEVDRVCCHGRAASNPLLLTPSGSPSPSPNGQKNSRGSGISTGATVAIAVLVCAIFVIAVVVLFILIRRYKNRRENDTGQPSENEQTGVNTSGARRRKNKVGDIDPSQQQKNRMNNPLWIDPSWDISSAAAASKVKLGEEEIKNKKPADREDEGVLEHYRRKFNSTRASKSNDEM